MGLLLPAFGSSSTTPEQSWYNADIHLHAQCSGLTYSAAELLDQMKQTGINVGSVLVWGGDRSLELDPAHFRGQEDDPVSEPNYIVRWGVEISELPGVWNGHMYLLNVAQKDVVVPNEVNYPGQDYLLPNYQYVQSQGGIVGYAHGQDWREGSYGLPLPDWRGFPRELPLDVALAKVDFLAAEVMTDGLWWLWYSMLNAGFHLPVLGDSDIGCYWPTVGKYHAAFTLPAGEALMYEKFIDAVREGRTVIRRNGSPPDFLDIRVNGVGLGGELILPDEPTTVNVQVDASSVIGSQRVELILNGEVIGSQAITDSVQTYQWSVPLNKSGWIAAKTTGTSQYSPAPGYNLRPSSDGAHTAATFVLLGGCPIRNDPTAARNWQNYLDAYYERGVTLGEFGASEAEVKQKVDQAKLVWERIAQEGEGSIAMNCTPDFTINAGVNDAWVNTDAPFQGIFITVFPVLKLVFAAWFTFDSVPPGGSAMATFGSPDQRWVTALGFYDGNRAELKAELTTGGEFNASDPLPAQDTEYGTINIEFANCENGNVEFDFPSAGESGTFNILRVVDSNVTLCEALNLD
jgi:hypothetical protein